MKQSTILYHYTDADGLLGIIEDKQLWATSILHLNDSQEFNYLRESALKYLKRCLREKGRELFHMDNFAKVARAIKPQRFVFCLSKHGDRLSQWRGYCPKGGGYSIGFPKSSFPTSVGRGRKIVFKCQYGMTGEDAKRTLRVIGDPLVDAIRRSCNTSKAERESYLVGPVSNFLDGVGKHAHRFKHPKFIEEHEWRVVFNSPTPPASVKYRVTQLGIVPYIEVPFSKTEPLPISEIIVGPTREPDLAENTIRGFLAQHGLSHVSVNISKIPYRT